MYYQYNKYEKYNENMEAEMDKNKFVGISKVGEKGQIVIPKEARDMFDIKPGDSVVVLCDKNRGMAIVKAESLEPAIEKFIPKGDK